MPSRIMQELEHYYWSYMRSNSVAILTNKQPKPMNTRLEEWT